MIISKHKKQTVTSLLIIILLSLIAYLIAEGGADFAGSMIVFTTFLVAVGVGILLLILRLVNIIKQPEHFLYNYFGTLNISLAVLQIVASLIHSTSINIKILLVNMAIGFAIFYDIYRQRELTS